MMKKSLALLLASAAMLPCGAWAQTQAPAADAPTDNSAQVVVTGTRSINKKAQESVSPIDVYSANALKAGSVEGLTDALTQVSPSITTLNFGTDIGALTTTIRMHGLMPDDTLVLVNGKRRHSSGYLYAGGGPIQGSSGVDTDLIPVSAIDHIEVLRDGAAAQYGSDAIAGVINIVLKNTDQGGSFEALGGSNYENGGATAGFNGDAGIKLGSDGFAHVSADIHYQDYTNQDGPDERYNNLNVDRAFGQPQVLRESLAFNAEKPVGDDVTAYAFATYSHRRGASFGFYRTLPSVYSAGYSPNTIAEENDYSLTGGVKGDHLLGFHWDLSATYGDDDINVGMVQSANPDLFTATGSTPTSFHLGDYNAGQAVVNFDLTRPLDIGLAMPTTVALGAEFRDDTYSLGAGDAASRYGSGSAASPGLPTTSAGHFSRHAWALYGDWDVHPLPQWEVDVAGRGEDYSDVGSAGSGKISTRYDFNPMVAIRGTFTNGFRAPSLAQEHYANLGVNPNAATGQLAVSSTAAALLGAKPLVPETSTNLSAGVVFQPISRMHVAVDFYQININNRITNGGTYTGQAALNALAESGYGIPPTVTPAGVSASYFANSANTRTEGVDLTADYLEDLDAWGTISWTLAAEFNSTKVTHINIDNNGNILLNQQQVGYLEHSEPDNKITLGARWRHDKFDIGLTEIRWGQMLDYATWFEGPNAFSTTNFDHNLEPAEYTTNLDINYDVTPHVRLTLGGENIFNVFPAKVNPDATVFGTTIYDYVNTNIGINGGFGYAKVRYTF
jgi:iron complex outermembrane receptor protein